MSQDLVQVYTGSIVEANFIKEILAENNISSILRDTLEESVIAGWGSGSPEDSALIFVENAFAEKATQVINDYMASR
ncbi:MAG: DUF2007 domain-containing protein [Bacteroidales bacterium]|nr:DUF2007 domain-containing protein [Bacteroidales bacterium]